MKKPKTIEKLSDLKPDRSNANRGTDRGRKMVAESLSKYGAGRSVVVDKNGNIIAGNKTVTAAGEREIIVVPSDGKKLVVVQRTDLDINSKAARELAIADNRTAEVGLDWDIDILKSLDVNLPQFWTEAELRKLIGEEAPIEGPDARMDEADQLQRKWKTAPGQLWMIPPGHGIYCGDATKFEDWERILGQHKADMCFTDPPWNVGIGLDSNPRHRQRPGLQNDSMSPEDFRTFIDGFAQNIGKFNKGDVYCVLGASEWPALDNGLRSNGFHWSATVIWVKDIFVLGRSKYHRRYEPLWYGWHNKGKSSFCGMRNLDDVWEIPRPRVSEQHPTIKPLELVARAIKNSSAPGDRVVDPFLGSGSTMVAAHQLTRTCVGMEIEPKYVAVTLERLSELGLKPQLVDHGKETLQTPEGKAPQGKPQASRRKPGKPAHKPNDTPADAPTGRIRGNRGRSTYIGEGAGAGVPGTAVEAGAERKSERAAEEGEQPARGIPAAKNPKRSAAAHVS